MKPQENIKDNIIWRLMERFSAKIVTFIVSVILARLLEPSTYGTIALVTVFTTILEVFVDSGLGNALIQKKDADDLDFSSVFYFNITMCVVLYLGMFLLAPFIANFYGIEELVPIVRVQSLTIVISGVKNIQFAYISRQMMFRKFFLATIFGTAVSAIVGIGMAYGGCGVWALVAQPLINYSIDTIMLWLTVKWRPRMMFSWKRLKSLLSYGWRLLAAKLLNTTYTKIRDLLIGKLYTTQDLAFFNKGDAFPSVIVPNVTASVDGVVFSAMAKRQDNLDEVRELVKKSTLVSSYIIFPMMTGLSACAVPLIDLLLTSKWLPSVPYMYMFCAVYAFWPLSIANLNSIRSLGRSDVFLKLEIIEKIVSFFLLLVSYRISVFAMGISYMLGELFSAAIVTYPNKKLINYGFIAQLKDLFPTLFSSLIMGIIVYCFRYLGFSSFITLCIQVPVGIILYLFFSKCLNVFGYIYLIRVLKDKLIGRKQGAK